MTYNAKAHSLHLESLEEAELFGLFGTANFKHPDHKKIQEL
jgi:hypothetical protein